MPGLKKVWERDTESAKITKKINFMRDVTDGTAHMREVCLEKDYLPIFPKESDDDYKTRKNITVFEPFTIDAIQASKGKIFAKKITLQDLPDELEKYDIIENFDRNGSSLQSFAQELCETQIREGVAFVYTAFPGTREDRPVLSKLIRPYARIVTGDSIISKKYSTINGQKMLWQVVIEETINADEDSYQQNKVSQYRKIYIKDNKQIEYVIYRRGAKDEEIVIETGIIRIAGQKSPQIPLEPCYGIKKGYFSGVSPFEELGYLNIEHYQKMSDYNMTYHRSAALTPVIIGERTNSNPIKDAVVKQQTQTGGPEILQIEQGGDFKWVGGSADIKAMFEHIEKRESRMKAMGFDVIDGGDKTATQINDERNDKEAKLKSIANNLETCLNRTILHMCEYLNVELGEGKVSVNKDFNLTVMPVEDLNALANMVGLNLITPKTFLQEAQAGERLLTIESIEDELDALNDGGGGL